jgi:hypothetical protein
MGIGGEEFKNIYILQDTLELDAGMVKDLKTLIAGTPATWIESWTQRTQTPGKIRRHLRTASRHTMDPASSGPLCILAISSCEAGALRTSAARSIRSERE